MITQYIWIALGLVSLVAGYNWFKQRGATATLLESVEPIRTLTPKIPSSADAFSATEVVTARLRAVGLAEEEIAAVRRPILDHISKEVKAL